jgi:hypothetical protein
MGNGFKTKLSQNWLLIVLVLTMLLVRLLWLQTTISRDEGGFGIVGMMWLRGFLPTYWLNVHGPILYLFYSSSIAFFGNTIIPIRLINDALFVFSCILVYMLSAEWFGKRIGAVSVFFFGFSMNVAILEGMTVLGEQLSIPFVLLALYLGTRQRVLKWEYVFLSGLTMSIACLTKITNAVGFIVLFVGLIFWSRSKQPTRFIRNSVLPLVIGAVIPVLPFLAYFAWQNDIGGLADLYFRTFSFGVTASDVPLYIKFLIIAQNLPVWVFSAIGAIFAIKTRSKSHQFLIVWAFVVFAIALIPPTFGHRFIPLLPVASILASIGVLSCPFYNLKLISRHRIVGFKTKRVLYFVSAILVVTLFVPSFYYQSMQYPQMNLFSGDMVWAYADSDYRTQVQVSQYLVSHMSGNDSLLVHGWSAEIYWLSGKAPPGPYVWTVGLLPQSEQIRIENLTRTTSFEKVVLFSSSMGDLFVRANSNDTIVKNILNYYFFETHIGNAFIFSKHSDTGSRISYSFIDSFNASSKYYDLGNASFGETENLSNQVFHPKTFVIASPYEYVIGQVPLDQTLNGETKSYISYSVHVLPNSSLQFGVGIDPNFMNKSHDIHFQVYISSSNGNRNGNITIFDKIIDPKQDTPNLAEREDVDLSDFANEEINIIFATFPGSSRLNAYSFAIWENPVIVTSG